MHAMLKTISKDSEKERKFERKLQTLVEKDRAVAAEDLPKIDKELDEHMGHLLDLRDTI